MNLPVPRVPAKMVEAAPSGGRAEQVHFQARRTWTSGPGSVSRGLPVGPQCREEAAPLEARTGPSRGPSGQTSCFLLCGPEWGPAGGSGRSHWVAWSMERPWPRDPGLLVQVQGSEGTDPEEARRRQPPAHVRLNKACRGSGRRPRENGTEDSGHPKTPCVRLMWTQHKAPLTGEREAAITSSLFQSA